MSSSKKIDKYVPPCTLHYAEAMVDPFGPVSGLDVCLPSTLLPLPTRKFTTKAMITWETGTNGVGFLAVKPGTSWTLGVNSIRATDATYAGTVGSYVAFSGAGTTGFPMTSIYATALSTNVLVRLVAFGTRTRVVTPGLNRGGVLTGYQSANRGDMSSTGTAAMTLGLMKSQGAAAVKAFGTETSRFDYHLSGPSQPDHLELLNSNSNVLDNIALALVCESSEPQKLITEMIAYWELIDLASSSDRTLSHSDPAHAGSVVAAVSSAVLNNAGHMPHGGGFADKVWAGIRAGWSAVSPYVTLENVVRVGGAAASLYSGNLAGAAAVAARAVQPKDGKKAIKKK